MLLWLEFRTRTQKNVVRTPGQPRSIQGDLGLVQDARAGHQKTITNVNNIDEERESAVCNQSPDCRRVHLRAR